MKVFLTGISGLLGTNLAIGLFEKGVHVRGLIRDKARYKGPHHPNLELIQGSLTDDLLPMLTDIDIVIHAAAETRQHLIHYADYHSVNCHTSIQLINAAVRSNVRKFVYVSTSNTLGFGSPSDLGNEQKPARYPVCNSFYAKSKMETEDYLLQHRDKTQVIIVHPGFMIGPYDSKPSSGRIILRGLDKKIIFYPPGGRNFVHVADVAKGIINSLAMGKNGEKYLLVNENLSYGEFFKKLNNLTHQSPIMVKVPRLLLMLLGYGGDALRRLGVQTSICSLNMRILCVKNYYSNNKSVQELGMIYQPIETAISDAVEYFREVKRYRDSNG